MFGYQEKITEQTKSQKTQFEEIEKASEPHLAGCLLYTSDAADDWLVV